MPKRTSTIYDRNAARIKAKVNDGASTRDLADDLNCSTSTAHKCKRRAQEDLNVSLDE
jgi:transposase